MPAETIKMFKNAGNFYGANIYSAASIPNVTKC